MLLGQSVNSVKYLRTCALPQCERIRTYEYKSEQHIFMNYDIFVARNFIFFKARIDLPVKLWKKIQIMKL